jgi:hypothetical protein
LQKLLINLTALDISDYPETYHPPIEDIVDDFLPSPRVENLVYPETDHPAIEDIIEI